LKDIEEDLEEFASYILEALKQSQGEVSNWDEILRKWKLIEKKNDQEARRKLKIPEFHKRILSDHSF
jgi:hypothetical protein